MKKTLLLVVVLFVIAGTANAQNDPKIEVWGTYSLLVADVDVLDNESLHGDGLGIQGNLSKSFGLVFEFTSHHGASGPVTIFTPGRLNIVPELDTKINTFLFGPRFSYRPGAVTLFGHALFGGASSKLRDEDGISGFEESNTEFAMAFGGGVDVNIGNNFAIRAGQFDYLPIHTDINLRVTPEATISSSGSSWLHNTRFQAGVVFKF